MIMLDAQTVRVCQTIRDRTGRRMSELYPVVDNLRRCKCKDADIISTLIELCTVNPNLTLLQLIALGWDVPTE